MINIDDYIGKWIVEGYREDLNRCIQDMDIIMDNPNEFDDGLFTEGLEFLEEIYGLSDVAVAGKIIGIR